MVAMLSSLVAVAVHARHAHAAERQGKDLGARGAQLAREFVSDWRHELHVILRAILVKAPLSWLPKSGWGTFHELGRRGVRRVSLST